MSVRDFLPAPAGSRLEYAFRMQDLEESRERKAAEARTAERAAVWQDRVDAAENGAFINGRQPLTHLEVLQTVSRLADIEEAAAERRDAPRAPAHRFGEPAELVSRADRLEEQAAQLRSQRDALRRFEDSGLAVAAARTKADAVVASRSHRGSSYR